MYQRIGFSFYIFSLLLILLSPLGLNLSLQLLSLLMIPIIVRFTWRLYEPPLLFYGAMLLWLNPSLQLFFYNWGSNLSLEEANGNEYLALACLYSLWGTMAVTLGLYLTSKQPKLSQIQSFLKELTSLNTHKVLFVYLILFILYFLVGAGKVLRLGGLAQTVFALLSLKWSFLYVLLLKILQERKMLIFLAVALLEIGTGLLGFFAGFRGFFLLVPLAYLTLYPRISLRQVVIGGIFMISLFTIIITWQSIKGDYRQFLNQGTNTQTVRVSYRERVDKLKELFSGLDEETIKGNIEALIKRIAYIDYFAEVIEYIPNVREYDKGAGWQAGIEHVLKPRIFFPDKPIISDSKISTQYTGKTVMGYERGASISIGYFGESYADFGPIGMLIPLFLVGLFYGLTYKLFVIDSQYKVIGYSIAVAYLIFAVGSLPSVPKLLGKNITNLVILGLSYLYLLPFIFKRMQN